MAESGAGIVDQFCRAGELQSHFYRRCQREMRDHVLPTLAFVDAVGGLEVIKAALAERDALKRENAEMKKQLAKAGVKGLVVNVA